MSFFLRPSRRLSLFAAVLGALATAVGVAVLVTTEAMSGLALVFIVAFIAAGVLVTAYHAYHAATGKAFALFTGERREQGEPK